MKKIIVGKSGTGKSKQCMEIAKFYCGTVVYLNIIPYAERYYEIYGLNENFIVCHYEKTIRMENNKKYFFSPVPSSEKMIMLPEKKHFFKKTEPAITVPTRPYILELDDAVNLFASGENNDYTRNIDNSLLIIMDDGYWEAADKNNALLLWQLSHSKRDIVITVSNPEDLVNAPLTDAMSVDLSKYWDVEILR